MAHSLISLRWILQQRNFRCNLLGQHRKAKFSDDFNLVPIGTVFLFQRLQLLNAKLFMYFLDARVFNMRYADAWDVYADAA